jgi:hypothetical protein
MGNFLTTRLNKITKFQKGKLGLNLEKLHAQSQIVQDTQKEKLGAIECDCGNVEVWWNNIKKCVLL